MTITAMINTTPNAISGPDASMSASLWLLSRSPSRFVQVVRCQGLDVELQSTRRSNPHFGSRCKRDGRGCGPRLRVHDDNARRAQICLCDALGPNDVVPGELRW